MQSLKPLVSLKKRTVIMIMDTMAQYIRLVRKLKKQSYGCCLKIASAMEDLLFKDLDVDSTRVWCMLCEFLVF